MTKMILRGMTALLFVVLLTSCAPMVSPLPSTDGEAASGYLVVTPGPVSDPGPRAMGRYREEKISMPEGADATSAVKTVNGVLYSLSWDGSRLLSSADYAVWESAPTGFTGIPMEGAEPQGAIVDFTLDADGALYILYSRYTGSEEGMDFAARTHVARCSGGAMAEIPYTIDEEETFPDRIAVLSNGAIALGNTTQNQDTYLFNAEGGEAVDRWFTAGCLSMAQYGDKLAFFMPDTNTVRILDGLSGEMTREMPIDGGMTQCLLQYDSQGALYYADSAGIFRCVPGGSLWERIVDGNLCSLNQPNLLLAHMLFDGRDDPILVANDPSDGLTKLYRFVYDPDVPTEPEIVLTIYALRDSQYLRQCVALFQTRFPEAMVLLDVALDQAGAITGDDAIRALNMEILGGQGPDLLVLDELPVQSYIEKGVLADIGDVVTPLVESGALLPGIANAFRRGDSLPAVPLRFYVPTLWGDSVSGLRTLEDLSAWAAARPDVRPFSVMTPQFMIERLYVANASAWYDERGLLKRDAIEAFLKAIYDLRAPWAASDLPDFFMSDAEKADVLGQQAGLEWNPYAGGLQGTVMLDSVEQRTDALELAYGDIGLISRVMGDVVGMGTPYSGITAREQGEFTILPGQAQNAFLPAGVLGLNAQSAYPDLAKEFVKLALSEELQMVNADGFSPHPAVLDTWKTLPTPKPIFAIADEQGRLLEERSPDDAARARLRQLIEELATPIVPDARLHDILIQESAAYFAGEMELGQAAQNVVDKANAYLSE